MARNCEKKFVGLNRMFIEKQQKEELEKNPRRPSLRTLHSATEVKKWIPGIKQEIEYYLQQLSGARKHKYPDYKVQEFQDNIERLEKQYKSFVAKVFELDPNTTGIPWQPRGYVSKRKTADNPAVTLPKKICTPLLDQEVHHINFKWKDSNSKSTCTLNTASTQSIMQPKITKQHSETKPCASEQSKQTFFEKAVNSKAEKISILGLDYSSSDED